MTRETSAGIPGAGRGRLRDAMAARVAGGELPGVVTVLARGEHVYVDVIGSLHFGESAPMRRDSLFRITSLTKPVLATVAMMLVDDGTLDPAEPVDRLLPELADRRVLARVDGPLSETVPANRPITLDDLLTFRLGFGMLTEPVFFPPYPIVTVPDELNLVLGPPDPRTPYPPDEWLRRFSTLPLMYQPGERWLYNVGALVLGVLVARAAGAPLDEVLRFRLFEPLGMADTGFCTAPENAARIPGQYMSVPGAPGGPRLQPLSTPDEWTAPPAFPSGSAGLLSTADDYLAFARLLRDGGTRGGRRLLSAEAVRLLTTNHLTPEQIATGGVLLHGQGWGYGMSVATVPDEFSDVPGRYGWEGGSGTVWFNDPHRDLIAIALTQNSDFLFLGGRDEFTALALRAGDR